MTCFSSRSVKWALLSVVALLGLPTGCGIFVAPEGVLFGTWQLTTPSSDQISQLLLTFDQNGNLTEIVYKLGTEVTITDSAPGGTTEVNGKDVTIATTFFGNSLIFNGTLNDANTVITGSLTTRIAVGTIVVTVNNGPGTLTKV